MKLFNKKILQESIRNGEIQDYQDKSSEKEKKSTQGTINKYDQKEQNRIVYN